MKKYLLLFLLSTSALAVPPGSPSPVIFGGNGATLLTDNLCFPDGTCVNSGLGGSGGVVSVTGSSPIISSGGATPAISCRTATGSVSGCLAAADFTTFNGKQAALGYTPVNRAGDTLTGSLLVAGSADEVQLAAKGVSGQTANIFEVQDSDSNPVMWVNSDGELIATIASPNFSGPVAAPGFYSTNSSPANAGLIQLSVTDAINWRNNNNDDDIGLSVDGSDVFQLTSALKVTGTVEATAGLKYTAGTSGHWATSAPTTVKDALDRLAAKVSNNGSSPIP